MKHERIRGRLAAAKTHRMTPAKGWGVCFASLLAGCVPSAEDRAMTVTGLPHQTSLVQYVTSSAEAAHAMVIVVNPTNCSIDTEWARGVNAIRGAARLRGVVFVEGVESVEEAGRLIRHIGLDFDVKLLPKHLRATAKEAVVSSLIVVRSGEPVLVATGSVFKSAPRWVGALFQQKHEHGTTEAIP